MKLCRTISIATLIIIGLNGQSVLADYERAIPIVGLWEGIDPDDGANQLRSITHDTNGTLSLTGSSTYFSLCGGTDRGVIIGTGVVQNGVIKAKETLTCFNNGQTIGGLEADYVLDRKNRTLTELRKWKRNNKDLPPIIFHLISPRPEYQVRK